MVVEVVVEVAMVKVGTRGEGYYLKYDQFKPSNFDRTHLLLCYIFAIEFVLPPPVSIDTVGGYA